MHDDVKSALHKALIQAGQNLQKFANNIFEFRQVWRRTSGQQGGWHTEHLPYPSIYRMQTVPTMKQIGDEFTDTFLKHYPMYKNLVGFCGFSCMNITADSGLIIRQLMMALWARTQTFQPSESEISSIIEDFSAFVEDEEISFYFLSQLLNYQMDEEHIYLPEGLSIRRLSEVEISNIYFGPTIGGVPFQRGSGIHQFAIEGIFKAQKTFGPPKSGNVFNNNVLSKINKAILALRTFKGGRVGCESIQFRPEKFCPMDLGWHGFYDLSTPAGLYKIGKDEVDSLRQHSGLIFNCSESTLDMACSRLADAETRYYPRDKLVDAVIGLEVMLLAGMGKEDRRGELRFRFSLNYSTLHATAKERYDAFLIARSLYDLRSAILHGGDIRANSLHKIGNKKLSLTEAADCATETLRYVVRRVLPEWKVYTYKDSTFWLKGFFLES